MLRTLDAEEQVGWLEVNISCPNVHGGGMRLRHRPPDGGRGHTGRQGRDEKAGHHEAQPQL